MSHNGAMDPVATNTILRLLPVRSNIRLYVGKRFRSSNENGDEVGAENPRLWDNFEWGMLNEKLSALRWILGDEGDFLDI